MKAKFYFFSGKGGVGKTTMACASAIYFASLGKKTLIVTTDPASNLADVFEQEIGHKITSINISTNLFALELDPDKATEEYKEKTIAPLRGIVPPESLAIIEEQLNSPCTTEVAAFERFTEFLQNPDFDVVIFDTAPTGHTLRLIQLPVEWSGVIEEAAKANYRYLRLDTHKVLCDRAIGMYKRLGFQEIEQYTYNPVENVIFMELKLG